MIDLQAAVAQAREYADQHVDDSDKWLASFDAKMQELGFANLKAPCRCADADMGHDPECGWGVVAVTVPAITADTKWKPEASLGPRMAKAFNEALSNFGWQAKCKTEITDHGSHDYAEMIGGTWQPGAAETLLAIKQKYGAVVSGSNYKALVADIEAATLKLRETRPVIDKRSTPEQKAEQEAARARVLEQQAKVAQDQEAYAAIWAKIMAKRPSRNEEALIVAEFHVDESDMQSDYHASRCTRRVAIGWRTGGREDFRQLRSVAATFKETEHYGPECDDFQIVVQNGSGAWHPEYQIHGQHFPTRRMAEEQIAAYYAECPLADGLTAELRQNTIEHRENYSMGGGNFLADERNSAWKVKSISLKYGTPTGMIEDGLPENSVNGKTADVKAGDITVTQNDAREGVEIRFASKPPAAILSHLKDAGWRWSKFSKCWYAKRSTKTLAFAYAMVGEKAPTAEDEGLRAMTNVDHFQEEAWASQVGK